MRRGTAAHRATNFGSDSSARIGAFGLRPITLPSETATSSCERDGAAWASAASSSWSASANGRLVCGSTRVRCNAATSSTSWVNSLSISRDKRRINTTRVANTDAVSAPATSNVHHAKIRNRAETPGIDGHQRRRLNNHGARIDHVAGLSRPSGTTEVGKRQSTPPRPRLHTRTQWSMRLRGEVSTAPPERPWRTPLLGLSPSLLSVLLDVSWLERPSRCPWTSRGCRRSTVSLDVSGLEVSFEVSLDLSAGLIVLLVDAHGVGTRGGEGGTAGDSNTNRDAQGGGCDDEGNLAVHGGLLGISGSWLCR